MKSYHEDKKQTHAHAFENTNTRNHRYQELRADRWSIFLVPNPNLSSIMKEAVETVDSGRIAELTSFLTLANVLFIKMSDEDLERIYAVICNAVTKSENPAVVLEIVKLIADIITQQPNVKPTLRLKILFNLYNLLEDGYCRYYVYLTRIQLAAKGKVTDQVIPSFREIDTYWNEWNVSVQDQRLLLLTVVNILKERKSSAKESLQFVSKYLATFSEEDGNAMSQVKDEAASAIIEFVKAPDMFQCDLLDMPAVAQLESDSKYSLIYQLILIFLTQRLDAYLDFQTANSELLKTHGLVHEDCVTKMRLVSLLDLASIESGQIPYAAIKDTLRVNDNEVEDWVLKAVSVKLLNCKMDKMNKVVIVNFAERLSGEKQSMDPHDILVTDVAAHIMQSMTGR